MVPPGAGFTNTDRAHVRWSAKRYARIGWLAVRVNTKKKMLIFTHGSKSHTNLRQRLIVSWFIIMNITLWTIFMGFHIINIYPIFFRSLSLILVSFILFTRLRKKILYLFAIIHEGFKKKWFARYIHFSPVPRFSFENLWGFRESRIDICFEMR